VFYLNDVVRDENFELNATTYKTLKLPNEPNFIDDDRETAEKEFWRKSPCMTNCAQGTAVVTGRARNIDVTPETGKEPKVE
jgi:cytochrome c